MPDPLTQDIDGAGAHRTQAVHRGNLAVGDCPVPAVYVDGDDFSLAVGLDLPTDVPLVYLLAEAGRLFALAPWARRDSPSWCVRQGLCVLICSSGQTCFYG